MNALAKPSPPHQCHSNNIDICKYICINCTFWQHQSSVGSYIMYGPDIADSLHQLISHMHVHEVYTTVDLLNTRTSAADNIKEAMELEGGVFRFSTSGKECLNNVFLCIVERSWTSVAH